MEETLLQLRVNCRATAFQYSRWAGMWFARLSRQRDAAQIDELLCRYTEAAALHLSALDALIAHLGLLPPDKAASDELSRTLELRDVLCREIELIA